MDTFAEKLDLSNQVCAESLLAETYVDSFSLQGDQILRKVGQHQWEESMNLYDQKVKIGVFLERNRMEKMKMEVGD